MCYEKTKSCSTFVEVVKISIIFLTFKITLAGGFLYDPRRHDLVGVVIFYIISKAHYYIELESLDVHKKL